MTTPNRLVRFGPVAACSIIVAASFLFAGPLNPPAGPIASTGKTLTEVEPRIAINLANTPGDADSLFKITQPGSYYLTGNITGVVGKHGIEIAANGVTVDLNGFDLVGVPAMGFFDGVTTTVTLTNIAVLNGSVRNWGDEGVDLSSASTTNCRVDNVRASGNTGEGIRVGDASTVSNCSGSQNTGRGIVTLNGCTVVNCTASSNTGTGISTGSGGTVTNCSASLNTINGINVGGGSTVFNCTAYANTGSGISCSNGSTISNCSTFQNGNGITTFAGCAVLNCTAYSNANSGINVGAGCTVEDCTARINALDGIVCSSQCVIRGNTCSFNGDNGDGAGIHATSVDNRIEGNSCTGADRGIDVDSAGNIIIRNTCSGNTINWDIVANNIFGAIIDRTAPGSLAVTGNAATGTLGTSDANANFSY